jgi:hypothetical protein
MDNIAMEKLISAIVAETVKSIVPSIMASMQGKPERIAQASSKKAGKLIKSPANDTDAFNIVKKYVVARKAGTIEKGPFLTCYRHITENSTLDDVIKSSDTAKITLYKEAQKVLNYRA